MNIPQQRTATMQGLTMEQIQEQQGRQDSMKEHMDAKKQAMEEQRHAILKARLEPQALERLHRVALVKPDKAKAAENHLLQMATGAQRGLIDENTVRSVLEKVSEGSGGGSNVGKIQFRRKKLDSDDDDF